MRFLSLLSVCLTLAACQATPTDGANRVSGLESSVPSIQWSGGDTIEALYALEWVETATLKLSPALAWSSANLWVLKGWEPARVEFQDSTGRSTGGTTQHFGIPDDFMARSIPKHETTLAVPVPANSSTLTIAFGNSGLETLPVRLPRR